MTLGSNDYPWSSASPVGSDPYGYAMRQCASFANWRMVNDFGKPNGVLWGNGGLWAARARAAGYSVDGDPQVGDVACLLPGIQGAGLAGHVAVVLAVLGNGQVEVEDYNWGDDFNYHQHTLGTTGVSFVHTRPDYAGVGSLTNVPVISLPNPLQPGQAFGIGPSIFNPLDPFGWFSGSNGSSKSGGGFSLNPLDGIANAITGFRVFFVSGFEIVVGAALGLAGLILISKDVLPASVTRAAGDAVSLTPGVGKAAEKAFRPGKAVASASRKLNEERSFNENEQRDNQRKFDRGQTPRIPRAKKPKSYPAGTDSAMRMRKNRIAMGRS